MISDLTVRDDNRRAADGLVRKGIRLEAAGRRSEAIECLDKGIALFPGHPFGRLHLGLALAGDGRFDEARTHLRRALELQPENAAFHLFAGRAFFDEADYAAAGQALDRTVELSPANDLARGYRVLNEWASSRVEAAQRLDADRLPDSTPFLARVLMMIEKSLKGRMVDYVDKADAVPVLDRLRIAWQLWRAGLACKKGLFDHAAMRAEMALEMRPGHAAAVALRRECRAAALEAARRRVAEQPDDAERRLEFAVRLADEDAFEEAAEQVEEAERRLAEDGGKDTWDSPMVLRLRGRIAYGMGRIDEAVALVERGAEPGFTMAETHYCLGLCHLDSGDRRHCLETFESLVRKICWAVPMRLREFQAWQRGEALSPRASEAQTSP